MFGAVYWHPTIYKLMIKALYGKEYGRRYKVLADEIGDLEVLDVCCGDGALASYLKSGKYTGLDFNGNFMNSLAKKGLKALCRDIIKDDLPAAECVLMQGSLYHFYPNHKEIIKKMMLAGGKKIIISEPVRNFSNSHFGILRFLAKYLTKTSRGFHEKRFTKEEINEIAEEFRADKIIEVKNDLILIFNK